MILAEYTGETRPPSWGLIQNVTFSDFSWKIETQSFYLRTLYYMGMIPRSWLNICIGQWIYNIVISATLLHKISYISVCTTMESYLKFWLLQLLSGVRLSSHLFVGLLLGILFYDFGNDAGKIHGNFSFIFFNVIFLFFATSMPTICTCKCFNLESYFLT